MVQTAGTVVIRKREKAPEARLARGLVWKGWWDGDGQEPGGCGQPARKVEVIPYQVLVEPASDAVLGPGVIAWNRNVRGPFSWNVT